MGPVARDKEKKVKDREELSEWLVGWMELGSG